MTKKVPYLVANQATIEKVEAILFQMKQPMNANSETQRTMRNDLKLLLNEILTLTQQSLLLNHQGFPNGVKADVVGWTTATTDYDNPKVLENLPHGKLVNNLLKELIKEQEEKALSQGVAVSETQILNAQNDALDASKDTITLETLVDPETNIKSKVEICKETGDTQLYRQDTETGFWYKVGEKLKGYWLNVKDFCKNIWGWVVKQYTRAKNWIKGLFKSPEESEIILAN